jgi:hypothetical protein
LTCPSAHTTPPAHVAARPDCNWRRPLARQLRDRLAGEGGVFLLKQVSADLVRQPDDLCRSRPHRHRNAQVS